MKCFYDKTISSRAVARARVPPGSYGNSCNISHAVIFRTALGVVGQSLDCKKGI